MICLYYLPHASFPFFNFEKLFICSLNMQANVLIVLTNLTMYGVIILSIYQKLTCNIFHLLIFSDYDVFNYFSLKMSLRLYGSKVVQFLFIFHAVQLSISFGMSSGGSGRDDGADDDDMNSNGDERVCPKMNKTLVLSILPRLVFYTYTCYNWVFVCLFVLDCWKCNLFSQNVPHRSKNPSKTRFPLLFMILIYLLYNTSNDLDVRWRNYSTFYVL